MAAAREQHYPLRLLGVGTQVHMAARRCTHDFAVGPEFWPSNGIVPGCGQANIWATLKMAPIIGAAVTKTEAQIEQYVDDLTSRVEGRVQR